MKVCYKNDLKQALMIIEDEEAVEVDYQTFMIQENLIRGLLKTSIRYVDDVSCYRYDISGKTTLRTKYEKKKMGEKDIRALTNALLNTMQEIKKYMLDGTGILLDPEYIYCEGEEYYFCYYPPCRKELPEKFHELTEFLVREVDYRDKEGVHLAYTLHKASMEENYSIEKIMEEIENEKEEPFVRYEKRMEEQEEHAGAEQLIAEEKNLWEPVRRFLERRRREKWGEWE